MVLNVTNLDWDSNAANVPLPIQTEDELKELHGNKNVKLETIAEIHASLVGDQKDTIKKGFSKISRVKEGGEYNLIRPVPNLDPLKHLDVIEKVKVKKDKSGLKKKLRCFFTKHPNKSSSVST